MSNGRKIIILIIIGLLLAAAWFMRPHAPSLTPANTPSADAIKFSREYTKVDKDNRFIYAAQEQIIEKFEKGDGLVFLGFPDCPWCQALAPLMNEAAKAENADIYYLNIQQARQDNDALYQKLLEKLKDHLRKDEQGNPRVYVPDVSALRGGKIVGHFVQETVAGGEKLTPDTYWTGERRSRAIEQLRNMISKTRPFAAVQEEVNSGQAFLIDVRTPEEFNTGHFENATNVPLDKIQKGSLPVNDKSKKIYVYCRSGNRSSQAVNRLKAIGFTNVKDLGGIDDVKKIGGTL